MGPSSFTVIYDACLLFSAARRDLFMHLAMSGLFRARWTAEIQEEWIEALIAHRPDLDRARLSRTRDLMNEFAPDSEVVGYQSLIKGLKLPDPDDRHVLAAAIRCGASEIITFNLKDFPDSELASFNIQARHPDEFAASLVDLSAPAVVAAARDQRRDLTDPELSVEQFLENLRRAELPRTASKLAAYSNLL